MAGARGNDGAAGPKGEPGAQGPAGPQGLRGEDAVLATGYTPALGPGVTFAAPAWGVVTPTAAQPVHWVTVERPARLLITATVEVVKPAAQAANSARMYCGIQTGQAADDTLSGRTTRQVTLAPTTGGPAAGQLTFVEQVDAQPGQHRAQITCFNETPAVPLETRAGTISTVAVARD